MRPVLISVFFSVILHGLKSESTHKEQASLLVQQFSLLQVRSTNEVLHNVEEAEDSVLDEFSASAESRTQMNLQAGLPGQAHKVQPNEIQFARSIGKEHHSIGKLKSSSLLEMSSILAPPPEEEEEEEEEDAPTDRFRRIKSVMVISLCMFVFVHLIFRTTVVEKFGLWVQSHLHVPLNLSPKGHISMLSSSSWSALQTTLLSMPNMPFHKATETELVPRNVEPCVLVQLFRENSATSEESDMCGICHVDGRSPARRTLQMQATINVDVKRMVEDEMRLEAKTSLEKYCATMRNTLIEEKVQRTFGPGDKEKIDDALQLTLDWLNQNQIASRGELEEKQSSLEEECLEMVSRLWTRPESVSDDSPLRMVELQQ